jgi:ribosomal protein L32
VSRSAHAMWVNSAPPNTVYLRGGAGRLMHRLIHGTLVYAELTHTVCSGCGALHERDTACRLCGTELPVRPPPRGS